MWPNLLRFVSRIGYAWARRRIDDESRREFDTHLDLLVDRYTRLGMTREEARVAARRQFGNVTRAREQIYEMNGIGWVDRLAQDLRDARRQLFRSPGFTLTTVLTLAIGIGATTAIFSVVNGILIKPLPFPESDCLIALVHQAPGVNQGEMAASPAIYFTYREHSRTFESVALWYSNTAGVTGGGDPG